ncbi:MAG: response regulator transcription factor [Chitinophagaceae bacterium]|nr:MAG: response regulator transcription factor [Chitinophagaceae bacterium]
MMIAVSVIDNNLPYRTTLTIYLEKVPGISVVFTGSSLSELPQMQKAKPSVVIIDIDLSEPGREAVQQVKGILPEAAILVLTTQEDKENIFASLTAGAIGYLLKTESPKTILAAIRSVHRGEAVFNGSVARQILTYFQKPVNSLPGIGAYNLTPREQEILVLLMDGLSYKDIAAKCFVSIDTVNSHIRKIYAKLNVRSRAEIAARFR